MRYFLMVSRGQKILNSTDIITKIKAREVAEKRTNYTFRLNVLMMNKFKISCENSNIPMGTLIEELISHFLSESEVLASTHKGRNNA